VGSLSLQLALLPRSRTLAHMLALSSLCAPPLSHLLRAGDGEGYGMCTSGLTADYH